MGAWNSPVPRPPASPPTVQPATASSWPAPCSGSLTFSRDGQTTGAAELTSEPGFLILTLHSNDDHLERLEDVIGRHLVRFGSKDELTVSWVRDDGQPGSTQRPSDED